ncbi:TetR/AcrR family transcriptional regulator [Sodalis sp. RH21]|uniref:TetR/AcrR family transcriptional regulator n=1 Tax=unclassified Sodalis (in: enterobacteria) TaxID=2636512 RepID=UPI0039B45469
MARPLSEEKRVAILNAAVDAVAEMGLSAPTAKIAKNAGIGDGTLFVYFANKEELFNQLYLYIKADLRAAVKVGAGADVKDQIQQFWHHYIDWGIKFPRKYQATRYLNAWGKLADETRRTAWALFPEFEQLVDRGFEEGVLRRQPREFLGELVDAIANMVLEFSHRDPTKNQELKRLGWEALWGGIRQ